MRAVILVPRRADHGARDRTWEWVKAWWAEHLPELEIHEGRHDEEGLFSRSLAVNRAAQGADIGGRWDVALIIDADVICHPPCALEAIARAAAVGDRLVLPFDRRYNLTAQGSEKIIAGDRRSWRRYIGKTYTQMVSSAVAIARPLWDRVGGFDETFRGWGFEDDAFAAAAATFGRPLERIHGELWHLWHPSAPEGNKASPSYQANRARRDLYEAARGNEAIMRRLVAGETPALEAGSTTRIPRILHRTVPAETSDQVEAWWARFAELHPGWQLRTYRDPLEPSEWPLTAKAWPLCRTGAQFADMIRLEALYREGGIYVDSDCEPYRTLEPLLELRAFAAYEDARVVPNAVLGAEPRHPAIKACLDESLRRLRSSRIPRDREKATWWTGTGVTTELLPGRADVLLLPPGAFYPYHYREKHRRDEPHNELQPWAFMAHHWAGSWLERAQDAAA